MGSSRRYAAIISLIARWIFFFIIIIFQLSLFSTSDEEWTRVQLDLSVYLMNCMRICLIPCRIGICTSPIEVTSSQLVATELCPTFLVKALLYPGAIAQAFIHRKTLPTFGKLLKIYDLNHLKKGFTTVELHRLEILAGSYLTVGGALLGVLRPGRMSLCGMLLIIWGFVRETILRKSANMNPMKAFHMYPTMLIAVFCAWLSIRRDVRKLIRIIRGQPITKSMLSKDKYM